MHLTTQKRNRHGEQGQVLILFTFVLGFFMLAVSAMVWDLTVLYYQSTSVLSAAQVAATAGAGQIDEPKFFQSAGKAVFLADSAQTSCSTVLQNLLQLSAAQANSACQTSGTTTVAGVSGDTEMTVHVAQTVNLPVPFLGNTAVVAGDATARPVAGTTAPASS